MEMLESRNAGMANFANLYNKANADQKLRDRYEYQMSVRLEENSMIKSAEDRGEERKARAAAKEMFADHMSIDKIAKYLGYSVKTIEKWLGIMASSMPE